MAFMTQGGRRHNFFFIVLITLTLTLFVGEVFAASVRFRGTVYRGVSGEILQNGGATFNVQSIFPIFEGYNESFIKNLFSILLTKTYLVDNNRTIQNEESETNSWLKQVPKLIKESKVEILENGRYILLTFAPLSEGIIEESMIIVPCIPISLFKSFNNFHENLSTPNCLLGNSIVLSPKPMIQIDKVRLSKISQQHYISGNMINIPLIDDNSGLIPKFRVMEGYVCCNTREAITNLNTWDSVNQTFYFIPHRGGVATLCYLPFPQKFPLVMIKIGESFNIAGPEGVSTEPPQIRTGVEFTGTVYGTNLSELDVLFITEQSCNEYASDQMVLPEVFISSSTRSLFFGVLNHEGIYHFCYRREGSLMFVKLTTILVEKGGGNAVIEGNLEDVLVDKVFSVLNTATIGRLQIKHSGRLILKKGSINVSSLIWSGGNIVGQGEIKSIGVSTITSYGYETRTITFPLKNYGEMMIDVQQLNLEEEGVIYNYGNLTITLSSMGSESFAGINSHGRTNVIINQGGNIYITTLERDNPVLCQTRILNTEGTIILSGRLNISDLSTGEKSNLVLSKDAIVSASDTRLRGTIMLSEDSHLLLTEDSAFISTVVKGSKGSISITGSSVLLDSLTVSGEVTANILGQQPDKASIVVAMYGTNRFNEGTYLNIKRLRFVTSTGLAKLLIKGIFTAEFNTVDFSGSTLIQSSNIAIIYGKSKEFTTTGEERNSLASLIIPQNSTLIAIDTTSFETTEREDNIIFTFSDFLNIDGRLLIQGSLTIPLGGTIGGVIEVLDIKRDLSKYLPDFLQLSSLLNFSKDLKSHGKLILGGEVHFRDKAHLILDEIIMKSASIRGSGEVYIKTLNRMMIDRSSRISLQRGWVINTSLLYIDGFVETDIITNPLIYGNLEITNTGELKLFSAPITPCLEALEVFGQIRIGTMSRIECIAAPLISPPRSFISTRDREREKNMRRMMANLPATLVCSESYIREEAEKHYLFQYFMGNLPFDPPQNIPTTRNMIIAGISFIYVGIIILYLSLRSWGLSWKEWYINMKRESPLRLTLPWSEFTSRSINYWVLIGFFFSAAQGSLSSFHPGLPLPIGFVSLISLRSVNLLMPHHRVRSDFHMRFISFFVVFWGIFAVPLLLLSGRINITKMRDKRIQKLMKIFFKLHYILRLLSLIFPIPIMSMALDFVACETFLSDLPSCETSRRDIIAPLASVLALSFMRPWGNLSKVKPLKCDLNFKISLLFSTHALMFVEVAMWKVFYQKPILLLLSNIILLGTRAWLFMSCCPTAYRNINKFITHLSLIPLIVAIGTLFHVIRVYLGFVFTCRDGEIYFGVLFISLVIMIATSLWFNVIMAKVEDATTNDAAIDAINRSIEQIRSRIQDMAYELLTCASEDERESVLNATARLRVELMDKQERYRFEKSRFLLTFFFCKPIVDSTFEELGGDKLPIDRHAPLDVEQLVASRCAISGEITQVKECSQQTLLSQEELESFRCGPALGSGSYGDVHLGILRCGMLVAAKYVNTQNCSNEALAQVKAEVNMLRELSHPNIIRYYGCSTLHGYMMVFMEFAVAGSLNSIVKKFTGVNESVICLYTHQVLLGLRYLHDKGVIHRDIKGENILVDGLGVVKLADFGCSKALAGTRDPGHAGCETLVGSPFWMAPEVIRNEPYGTRADIWSVGCTVVEMLNGGLPPWSEEFDNAYSAMFYVGSTDNIPSIPENTSELCRNFLKECFQRDTAKRPSADELLQHPWLHNAERDSNPIPEVDEKYSSL